ncbi:MAG: hypothetical protein GF308_01080 [Candidatus Heimdallarchaeota archaeon]|nr:hypothetical protein [Candidatus Heimdallarchaeota archaeon]
MLNRVGKALRIISDDTKKRVATVIDTPTLFPDFNLELLKKIRLATKKIGTPRFGKVITNQRITHQQSEIIKSYGFQEEIVSSDVDIYVAITALELCNSESIDVVTIGTTDINLLPVLSRIKLQKNVGLISWEEAITPALEAVVDFIIYLDFLE